MMCYRGKKLVEAVFSFSTAVGPLGSLGDLFLLLIDAVDVQFLRLRNLCARCHDDDSGFVHFLSRLLRRYGHYCLQYPSRP
jgi:hypothetical protein